jgi:Flp pilus assembly pilin Flp
MICAFVRRLRASRSGAAAVEFAMIAPFLITGMLGVFQVGIGMQNYNALRAVSAELGRFTVVNYQTGNRVTNTLIRLRGRAIASAAPYNLKIERLEVIVSNVATPRIAGTEEKTIELRYRVPTMLSVANVKDVPLNYTRTVVLPTE